jgi:Kef-type K+ transport system membrane component KefB
MKPRAAGITGIVVALALAVLGGYLLARPPWSIPGALVLVAASVTLSISIVWTRRRSWAELWPPDVTPSLRKQVRLAKVSLVVSCVLLVACVGLMVVSITSEAWNQVVAAVLVMLSSASNLVVLRTRLLALHRQDTLEQDS